MEKTKKIFGFAAVGLAGVLLGGVIGGIIGYKVSPTTPEVSAAPVTAYAGRMQEDSSVTLRQTYNTRANESSVTITAEVSDSVGNTWDMLQEVTWSMAWASGGTGNVNEYMQMTTNGTSATFTIKKAFTTQIIVTCTSVLDPSVKSTATLDYYKRFKSISVDLPGCTQTTMTNETGGSGLGTSHKLNFSSMDNPSAWGNKVFGFATGANYDVGTVNNSGTITSITVSPNSSLAQAMQSMGGSVNSYTLTSPTAKVSQNDLLNGLFGSVAISNSQSLFTILNVLSTNTVDLVVDVSVNNTYGGTSTVQYYLDVDIDEIKIGGIELTPPSFIF